MKTTAGAALRASLKSRRMRAAPRPANISTNEDADCEKNCALRLVRDGLGEQRLARARRPVQQHALRHARAEAMEGLGVAQELDDLDRAPPWPRRRRRCPPSRPRGSASGLSCIGFVRGITLSVRHSTKTSEAHEDDAEEAAPVRPEVLDPLEERRRLGTFGERVAAQRLVELVQRGQQLRLRLRGIVGGRQLRKRQGRHLGKYRQWDAILHPIGTRVAAPCQALRRYSPRRAGSRRAPRARPRAGRRSARGSRSRAEARCPGSAAPARAVCRRCARSRRRPRRRCRRWPARRGLRRPATGARRRLRSSATPAMFAASIGAIRCEPQRSCSLAASLASASPCS